MTPDSRTANLPALTLTKRYNATRQELFNAWVDPVALRHWMCPEGGSVILAEVDLRVGGAYRIDMQLGAEITIHTGVYHEIDPPQKLVFSWTSKNTQERASLVTVELFERGEQTELRLTHAQLPDAAAVDAHKWGWTSIFARLEGYLVQAGKTG
jgi:uncharacterized protein YndB with AHSA1/START domain